MVYNRLMESDMAGKNGSSWDKEIPEVPGNSVRRETGGGHPKGTSKGKNSRNGASRAHKYHGGSHRQRGKQQKPVNGIKGAEFEDYSLDTSLEDELMNGNYRLRGRRAQVSINHLLQFQLPEIEREQASQSHKSGRRRNQGESHVHLHGDSFINANYRLLVDDRFDYKEQSADPNISVSQEKIVRVIVPRGQNCPICLSEDPVAPHMVACGHIFCLSCLLNFFSVEEPVKDKTTYSHKKKLKECPLCGSIVRREKVKPVLAEDACAPDVPKPGSETTIKLMCKPHGSILPLPVQLGTDPVEVGDTPSLNLPHIADYAHYVKCSSSKAVEYYEKDLEGILNQYEIDKILYNDQGKYYKMAIDYVNDKINSIRSENAVDPMKTLEQSVASLSVGTDLKAKYDDAGAYFFYQTSFSSPIRFFLSPLDVKVLLSAFHHYSNFPEEITVAVENVNYGSVLTPEMARRYKYFGHLPLGTELAFLEIDWRDNDILPGEVYQQFIVELKQRRRKLSQKRHKEDKQKIDHQRRLEREHAEFYKRENGHSSSIGNILEPELLLGNDNFLDSLSSINRTSQKPIDGDTEGRERKPTFKEKTIWGTSIPINRDEQSSKENEEFEAMLLQKMQQDDAQESYGRSGKKKGKKKGKVMLFSSGHQTL